MRKKSGILVFSLLAGLLLGALSWQAANAISRAPPIASEPTPDPLAVPVLPENPTQIDLGSEVYFYHCMPCHGDKGQGLTDEFREIWVDDHQNCWAPGCHGGRADDEGFPIPRYVPGVEILERFPAPEDLFNYLQQTHPPQRPGVLADEEYWEATAFVLHIGGRLEGDEQIGPTVEKHAASPTVDENPPNSAEDETEGTSPDSILVVPTLLTIIVLLSLALIWQSRQPRYPINR